MEENNKTNNESRKWLYDKFVAKGINVGKDYDEFDSLLTNNNESRKWAYDKACSLGYNVGKDYDEFNSIIGAKSETEQTEQPADPVEHVKQDSLSVAVDEDTDVKVQSSQRTMQPETTEDLIARIQRNGKKDKQEELLEALSQRQEQKTAHDRYVKGIEDSIEKKANELIEEDVNLSTFNKTKDNGLQFNPSTGKLERSYSTPYGNTTTDRHLADMESSQYASNMTVSGQLRQAQRKLDELEKEKSRRSKEVHEEATEFNNSKLTPLGRAFAGPDIYVAMQTSDPEKEALDVAIQETKDKIERLQREINRQGGKRVGYFRGIGTFEMSDLDMGFGELRRSMTLMNADKLVDGNATEGERKAYDHMMKAIYENEQSKQEYPDGWWFNMGVMTKDMVPFMIDIALFKGATSMPSVFAKGSTKVATKVIGKEVVEEMAKQGFKSYVKKNGVKGFTQYAADWGIKTLGVTADNMLISAPLMVNTVQGAKTASDIIDRKLGSVVVNEDGTYDFSNDKTWSDAIWQGEANAIIEAGVEMSTSKVLSLDNMSKLAEVIGAKRISGLLARTDASALGAMMSKTDEIFNKMGISDIFGEVGEEYKGQFYRTILNLDDAYIQNSDGSRTNLLATWDFHKDVWGGTALAMGSMSVVRHGATAANYTRHKHNVNKADNRAGEILGRDVWEPIRIIIDQSTNEDMGDVMKSIIQDREFTDEEVFAVLDYAERNMILRGFNLATLAQSRNADETDSDIIAQQNNESFLDGYNASTPQEMNDANNNYLYHRENMVRTFGLTDESDIDAFLGDNPIETVARRRQAGASTEETQTIIDYINAKATYDGMLQSVRDDIDGRIEQSNARIDSYVNRSTGNIHGAVLKQDDRLVYIVNGNAVAFDDGVIDTRNSSNTIIVKDAETGELKQISPSDLLTLYDVQDPNEQKEISAQQIRNGVADESLNKINGVVDFNDKAQFLNEAANQIAITMILAQRGLDADYIKTFLGNAQIVENPDGTLTFTDGQNEVVVPKQEIQQQVDANNMQRVADFNNQVNGTRRTRNSNVALSYLLNKGKGGIENIGLFLHAIADAFPNVSNEIEDIHNGIDDKFIGMDPAEFIAYDFYEIKQIRQIVYNAYGKEGIDIFDELLKNASGFIPSEGLKMENRINSLKSLTDSSTDEMPETAPENPQEGLVQQGMNNTSSTEEKVSQTPQFSLIPKDVSGNPIYEQADSETAWDALMEDAEGDEMMAGEVAKSMIADKEAELKKLEKSKIKEGKTPAEKMAALKERKAEVEKIKQDIEAWKKIAAVPMQRQIAQQERIRQEEAEAAAKRKADEERLLAERKEAERKEQELLNGIPDYSEDTPQNARARGYRRVNGHIEERQQPIEAVQGKETEVEFSNDVRPKGHYAVIDASQLQPSHIQGNRNPLHFLDEAQPKERNDKASIVSAQKIAGNIRPATITTGETAYVGTPTVNTRGEVIQGNSRSDALKLMYGSHNDQAQTYKQYLINNAEQFGLNPEDVSNMESPVLVRMLDVSDEQAITLGQYVAQDTESGGVERIKPKNAVKKMGDDINSFANMLLDSADEDTSFAELLDQNGVKVLKWMAQKGYITDTQYSSAFDTKGSLTAEAKNDLRGIMYQSIFEGGNTRLEEMFNALPAKAQKAILATAHRDFSSPSSESMIHEIQNSIRAFYALMQDAQFAKAKNFKEADKAADAWQKQYQMDDITGESYLPSEKFTNFALLLAKMYKGEKQSNIQSTFEELYDLIQGTKEDNLFEQADNTPRTLAQAIKEVLNIDYNGQRRSIILDSDIAPGQQGQHGSSGNVASEERTESGERTDDDSGRIETDSNERQTDAATGKTETESNSDDRTIQTIHQSGSEREGLEQTLDGRRQTDGTGMADDAAGIMETGNDRSDIRVFEEGLATSYREHSKYSERARRTAESERLVNIAKQHGLFIPAEDTNALTGKLSKRTGESVVYIDTEAGIVTKVKDPYAKSAMKSGVQPEDAVFEHLVHNLLFPETAYTFEGISEDMGDVRIVLSQSLIQSKGHPTKEQIAEALAERGLFPEDKYSFGNEFVSVTDVEGDNVILGEDGNLYFIDPIIRFKKPLKEILDNYNRNNNSTLGEQIKSAEKEVNTSPTDKQKEAGNYKKGHVQIGTFNITIEQPKGSVRSGVDANGRKWETTMHNTYGYIRGTEGVDGDHIDVFLSDDIDGWNGSKVFVVDQYNEDGTFDEHKVMLGFNTIEEAESAYLDNYEKGWEKKHKIVVSPIPTENFEKWIVSSHRKTKPFAEYKSVKSEENRTKNNENRTKSTENDSKVEENSATDKELEADINLMSCLSNRDLKKVINDLKKLISFLEETRNNPENKDKIDKINHDITRYRKELEIANDLLKEHDNGDWKHKLGVKLSYNKDLSIEDVKTLFENLNTDEDVAKLFERVFAVAKTLGLKIKVTDQLSKASGNAGTDGIVKYAASTFYTSMSNQEKAGVLLHELIHTVTMHTISLYQNRTRKGFIGKELYDRLPEEIKQACKELEYIYYAIVEDDAFKGQYGITSMSEMIAELSNVNFRNLLKEKNLWVRIINSIKRFFGFEIKDSQKANNALIEAEKILVNMLDNFDRYSYDAIRNKLDELGQIRKRIVSSSAQYQKGELVMDAESEAFRRATERTMKQLESIGIDVEIVEDGTIVDNTAEKQIIENYNEKFNRELQQQIDGTLPKGHIYQLGMSGVKLQSAGIPYLPIELAASRLSDKSMQENHPFELSEIEGLVEAVQNPLAVFRSATRLGSFVVLTEIQHEDKNYVAAIQVNRKMGKVEVNTIRSIYPKDGAQIANWIEDGLSEYVDKEKMSEWISKQRSNSADVRNLFRRAAKIIQKFENRAIRPNFSRSAGIFYSNAKKAVLDIKQDKATPEQWLKMIEKNGGLKASEDRWLGLSDWLKTQQKRKNIDVQYAKEYDGEAKQIAHGIKEGDNSSIDLAAIEMAKLVKDGDILIPIPSRTGKATTSLALANRIAELAGKGKVADVLTGKERESLYNIKKEGKELPKASELEFVLKNQDVLNGNNRVVFVDNVMGTGTTLEAAVELIPNATALVYAKDNSTLSDKKTLTKDEILNFINENSIQIEEVHYSQFGEGLIDEATRKLDAELKGIGWDAMLEKYPGFDELFELFDGELVWSENRASIGEYEDFIIDNKITDVNPSDNAINETREGYTTSGLKGNREIALTVPGIESYNSHDAVHFGDAGGGRAVAWIRFGETTDKDGKRVLVIDEIQSKRHQDGREKGYRDDKTLTARLDALKESAAKAGMTFNADVRNRSLQFLDLEGKPIGTMTRKPTDEQSEIMAQVRNVLFYNDGVPSAPFEKNWQELAMKRMLRYAAENGFDKVAWTTGEQQAERYNMSSSIESISSKDNNIEEFSDGTTVSKNFALTTSAGMVINIMCDSEGIAHGGDYNGKHLSEIVGKELAEKMMQPGDFTLSDEGLKLGGEGMKGFYDKILPSFVSKYTKKWGGKVEETELPETGLSMHSVDVTPQMKEDVMKGQPMFHKGQMSFDFLNQQDTPLSDTRLRKLEEGETSKIERIFTENKNFDFTSGEKIESIDDVAFIFKQLEDESIENSFAVLVKDGKPTVIHLGMGSYTATGLNGSALNVAVERIQPDKIYFIHNHPSGNLTASRQDIELLNRLKSTYGDIFEDGIIINLRSGKFATFNAEEKNIHDEKNIDNAVPVKVYSFNKQVFEKNYDPAETFKIRSSSDVAKFISSHRLGERPKLGILVCNNQLGVVGNVFTPYTKVTKENAKDIAKDIVYYTTSMGGTCAMMFGNANIYEVGSKRISQHVEDISTGSIKLMDYLNMQKDGSYWSASDEGVSFMRTSSGTIYGWTVDGKVYLTKDGINPNTPVHEYSHLWAEALMKNDPVLWSRIVNGLKDTPVWNEVMLDEEYSSIHHNDNLVASEVLSRLSGTENYRRTMEEAQREIESEKGIFAKAEKITIWERVKQALKDFWNWVVKTYGTNNITPEEAVNMTLNDFWNGIRPDVNDNPMQRMFVGEKGAANIDKAEEATARLDNLSVARKMEAEGKDAKNIKLATGWERGSDGKWRYEVMDNFRFDKSGNVDFEKRNPEYRRYKELIRKNNSLAFEGKELSAEESAEFDKLSATWKGTKLHNSRRLKDYIDAPELFEAYPELKDVDVKFAVLEDGVQGKYNHKQKTVTLNAMLGKEAAASTLNHEIQHAIQHIEGFAKGGNSNDVITRKQEFKSEVRNLHEMMLDTPEWAEYVRLVDRWIDNEDASVEARIEAISNSGVLDGIRSEHDRLRRKYGNNTIVGRILNGPYAEDADIWNELPESFNDRFDAYRRLAGEVESRNVQRRMEMNEEERRSSLAQETEDVAREDQVFLHGALENAEEDDVLYRDDEYKTEKIFGGIWIEDKQEFAKFVSAVNNNYVFEEDGKGIAYTDNHFYAYYWNIDGEPIPYIDVYLNAEESQEVVNLVNEEIKNDGKEPRVESYVNSVVRWARTRQSSNNGNNGNNNSISSSRKIDGLDRNILRKGRYFDNPSLYVKTQRADRYNRDGINSTVSSSPAPAQRRQMVEHAENLAKRLHLDNIEIVNSVSGLEGKKKSAKGFYEPKTGKITIVIPNNTSIADIDKTLLHEAVAHYGLRQLFGEHFDTFLDNVYNNAEESIRKRISELAIRKYNYDFRKATEEYLASLAENTNFENAQQSRWWQKVKDFFADMLSKLGFKDFRGVILTDNELRYVLWRSYENLKEKKNDNIFSQASDIAKQYELGVGDYAKSSESEDDVLFRDGDDYEKALAREQYERRLRTGWYQTQEALQDSMLGLKEAMSAILEDDVNIEDVEGFENAYLGENRLSSVNKAEADAFAHILFKPMLDEVAKLSHNSEERETLTDYMMAKHGLERNEYMRQQAIQNGEDANRDFAGLTSLTGFDDITAAEAEAKRMVDEYEQDHDTTELWDKVNAVSNAILQKLHDSGLMSKETFDNVSSMYQYYIPLRGFEEKTSEEAYAYLTHSHSVFNAPIKKAQGRSSKADDPFSNLQSMAESAIMQGNRNRLVKQRFLNFVLNHPSDLVSVSEIWLEYDNVDDEWRPVFPDNLNDNDTPEEIERKFQEFEEKMQSLSEQYPDKYKHGKDAANIPYRIVESRDMRQHQVVVKRGGRDIILTINGNPRAAQALNGQTNPDNDMSGAIGAILRSGEWVNRQLSAFYTTRNPDFIVSNFLRDMFYTNTMAWVKESPNYALRFHKNYMMANPITMKRLLNKYRKGTLDTSDKIEGMFYQFMINGGETGYANVRDIEQHKNDIRKELRRSNGKLKIGRALSLLAERFDELNRAVENCARFAAFVTSREMGRTVDRSVYDAKEISVNFNKKGSGAKFYGSVGQTFSGNASALASGLGRSGFVFWNAAIQGTTNFGRQIKRHPAKAFTGIASMFLLGALVAFLGGDDDDDDNKNSYYNLPEYVRRSNILFRAGEHWISIPLPIEYRAFYGMGELMTSVMNGKEHMTDGEIAEAIAGQVSQILPIDFLEGGGGLNAFVPSAVKPLWEAYVIEKGWTGMPIYKDTPYNKNMPEWTKAYSSANKHIVNLAASLNEATGGDRYTKGSIDINPAKIEYMLNGYFGGVFSTINKLSKTAETISGSREYDPRNILLLNRVVKAGDERTEYRAVNNEYFRLKEEHDQLKMRLGKYENDTYNGIFDYAEKIDFLYNSPEYQRYEIFEFYNKEIKSLNDMIKNTYDNDERKELESYLNELKKEMIEEINKTRQTRKGA